MFGIDANRIGIGDDAFDVSTFEIRPLQICVIKVRPREIRITKIVGLQIFVTEVPLREIAAGQIKIGGRHCAVL
jgi:hypothetical protein